MMTYNLVALSVLLVFPAPGHAGARNPPKQPTISEAESPTLGSGVDGMWESLAEEEDRAAVRDDDIDGLPSVTLELGADGFAHLTHAEKLLREKTEENEDIDDEALSELKADPQTETDGEGILSSHDPLSFLPVLLVLLFPLLAAGFYFKRQAEALKSKALSGSESEGDESGSDETVSFDNDNPRVMVNKQLLDRMTSISNKLKASVQQARSETTSSVSSNSQKAGPANGSRRSPQGSSGQGSGRGQASGV